MRCNCELYNRKIRPDYLFAHLGRSQQVEVRRSESEDPRSRVHSTALATLEREVG